MTYFLDLTPYTYGEQVLRPLGAQAPGHGQSLLNVGWLAAGEPFASGEAPAGLLDALLRRVADHRANQTRGMHLCELCAEPVFGAPLLLDGEELWLGSAEIHVTGEDGTVYAAPTLIAHYVAEHRYLPPEPFVEAVLHGPVPDPRPPRPPARPGWRRRTQAS